MMMLANIFAGLVMIIHVYIFLLETVLFKTRGVKAFQIEPEMVDRIAVMFSNQGCYNGFLAAALLLGFILPDPAGTALTYYGLGCVAVAGIWGAVTVKKSILYIQTVPAALGLITRFLAG